LLLVDPKRLELGLYEEIPHLLAPVVTIESGVERFAQRHTEMESRLKLLAARGVRNIDQYNARSRRANRFHCLTTPKSRAQAPALHRHRNRRVADLMMVDTSNVEESITRLAQMARAVAST